MPVYQTTINLQTRGADMYAITGEVARALKQSGLRHGIGKVFCLHTSASLVIMENADPSARADLQAWLNRLVPEDNRDFTHTIEGADDMPGHIKMALTRTSESVPFAEGCLLLGTWQGIYFWEHRRAAHHRQVQLTFVGE